jgi:hypothetical protein
MFLLGFKIKKNIKHCKYFLKEIRTLEPVLTNLVKSSTVPRDNPRQESVFLVRCGELMVTGGTTGLLLTGAADCYTATRTQKTSCI